MVQSGGWQCFLDVPDYRPTQYTYTDPYGRIFVMKADGTLQSITDLNKNRLTFSRHGIVGADGTMVVTIRRDSLDRITQISDPVGNSYRYSYDSNGDLVSVTMPGVATPTTYGYEHTWPHLIHAIVDALGHPAALASYDDNGRLQSETTAVGDTTSYAYDLVNRITTTTNPDGGILVLRYTTDGLVLSKTGTAVAAVTYTYDSHKHMLTETDAAGQVTRYTYDSNGHRTSRSDPLGRVTRTINNRYGAMTSFLDPAWRTTTIGENAQFMPTDISDSQGLLGSHRWDSHGSLLTRTDALGQVTQFTYDSYGHQLTETDPLSRTTSMSYDIFGRRLSSTDALGQVTRSSYDALGHLLTQDNALNERTTYEYDANGNQTAIIAPTGRRMTFTYDAANRQTGVTYPDGSTETTAYDFRGYPRSVTDRAGHRTEYQYDLQGQQIAMIEAVGTPEQRTLRSVYNALGRKIQDIDALGHATSYAYDAVGQTIQITDPLNRTTQFTYDQLGQRTTMVDALNRTTQYQYDERGHPTVTIAPDGSRTTQVYDARGQLRQRVDELGRVTSYAYDAGSQLLRVTNPLSQTTAYQYDVVGNMTQVTDANGHTTQFAYDALKRSTQTTLPDGSIATQTYDLAGDRIQQRATDGSRTSFQYDTLHRLTQAQYADGQSVQYSYTPMDARSSVTDARGTTQYQYDALDRLRSIAQPNGQQIVYTYDAVGNRLSLTTAAGATTYRYDVANQLIQVTDFQQASTIFAYDALGNRTQRSLPNGVTTTYGYDLRSRLTNVTHATSSQTLASFSYTLDAVGNRRSVTEHDGTTLAWGYDAANRLIREQWQPVGMGSPVETQYSYDAVGNRLTQLRTGLTTTSTYNALDQLVSSGSASYRYDGRGNLTQVQDGSSTTTYSYDARNRMTAVQLPGGSGMAYGYDADGRRISTTMAGATVTALWDEASPYGDIVLERDASGTVIASYTLAGTELIAQQRGGNRQYYLQDAQGSVRALTSSTGAVTDRYSYDAFGSTQSRSGSSENPYQYTGQRADPLTGLYQLRARYYQSDAGRFLSRDTMGLDQYDPAEWNRYSYARNNPVRYSDPLGLSAGAIALNPPVTRPWPQPRQQARGGGGALAEYALIASLAIGTAAGVAAVGQATFCNYSQVYSIFLAITKDGPRLLLLDAMVPPQCIIPIVRFPGLWQIQTHILLAQYSGSVSPRTWTWIPPQPMLLTYRGPAGKSGHPRPACTPNPFRSYPAGFTSCDEYPFASTIQGGGLGVSIMGVDPGENTAQGIILSAFYRGTNRQGHYFIAGDIFAALGI